MKIGIIGNGADKFTRDTEGGARTVIRNLLAPDDVVVSGHSPMGGVDLWAEEIAAEIGAAALVFAPESPSWQGFAGKPGFKARNLDIAQNSDVVHVIVVAVYPPQYKGRRFPACYHCNKTDHVKSGACWTAKEAQKLGKRVVWHII